MEIHIITNIDFMKKVYLAPKMVEVRLETEGMMRGSDGFNLLVDSSSTSAINEGEEDEIMTKKFDGGGNWD